MYRKGRRWLLSIMGIKDNIILIQKGSSEYLSYWFYPGIASDPINTHGSFKTNARKVPLFLAIVTNAGQSRERMPLGIA